MRWIRNFRKALRARGQRFTVIATLTVIGIVICGLTLSLPARAQQPPPIPIQVDGQTVLLELGKNVHPQTYALLSQDPDFVSRADVEWVFVDDMWVPLDRKGLTEESLPGEGPIEKLLPKKTPPPGPTGIPECKITLNVPAYSQCSSPWGSARLFNDPGCPTMCSAGCAITSATMVFRYYGASKNPGQVNDCCGSHSCRSGCDLAWACAADYCSDNRAGFVGSYSFYWAALCGLLYEDRPPIVKVGGHFVVVYKSLGYSISDPNDYFIVDPLDGSKWKKLSYYTTPSRVVEYYKK